MALPTKPDPGKGKRLLEFLKFTPERWTIYQPYTIRILLEQGTENNFSMEQNKIVDKINSLLFHDKLSPPKYRKNLKSLTKETRYTWHTDLVFFDDTKDPPIWKLNQEEFDESQTEEILKECNKEISKFHVKILFDDKQIGNVYFIHAGKDGKWYDEFLTTVDSPEDSIDFKTAGIDYSKSANFDLTSKTDDELRELSNGVELITIKNIKKGDIVVIKKNNLEGIVNVGIVIKEYYFDKNAITYIHRIGVKYLNIPIPQIIDGNIKGIFRAVTHRDEILTHLRGSEKDLIDKEQQNDTLSVNYGRTIEILRRKKNIILSGPPGTGKTYTAKKIAKSLVASNSTSSTHQFDLNKNYFMINGGWSNLGFSLSQEPFIWATQGTDPSTKAVWERLQPGDVVFVSNSKKDHGPFHSEKVILAIGICVKKFMGTQPYWQDEKEKNKVIYDYRFELKLFRPIPSKAIQFNSIGGLPFTKGFNAIANEENIKQLLNEISINWSDGSSYIENITFHQSFSYEEFLEGIKPKVVQDDKTKQRFIDYSVEPGVFKKLCMRAEIDSDNTYAMIIDEINRGNISKIFGELITIIENDKRGDEVTLSYSGKKFSVPENVYIIGTMNTADQSLTQIDAALKRRFSTVEVMPSSLILKKLIEQTGIGLVGLPKLLDKINAKIRVHRTRHNQIGHSYFMHDGNVIDSIKELQFVFATDVIPLLQDYFYADEDALKDVLSNQFIDWGDDETGNLLTAWQDYDDKFKEAIKSAFDIIL